MHDEVIRFAMEGEISDRNIVQQKERLVQALEAQMKDEGCIPVLDMDPHFTLDYSPDSETYQFTLSIYGTYEGQDAWLYGGKMFGKRIQNSSVNPKLSQSLPPAV